MNNQLKVDVKKSVCGDLHVDKILPFQIVQAPFKKLSKYERDGHWNEKERLKYTIFLSFFKEIFENPLKKKNLRIYDMMSDMIITRNSNQCRSHHQKMEKFRETIPAIIASVAQKYQPRVYKQIEEKYLSLIKVLLQNADKYVRITQTYQNKKARPRDQIQGQKDDKVYIEAIQKPFSNQKEEQALLKNSKEQLKKTADSYSDEEVQEDNPVQIIDFHQILKEECKENEFDYKVTKLPQKTNTPKNTEMNEKKKFLSSIQVKNLIPLNQSLSTKAGLLYYEQQIKSLYFQKQWHMHNAEHLMLQWNSEIEAIKLCDEKIKVFKEAFSPKL